MASIRRDTDKNVKKAVTLKNEKKKPLHVNICALHMTVTLI